MDAHELCISEVLEEHGVPTPPNPQPPQHPHPSRSSAGWGGVLRVCLCVCVSMRSSLRAGVHRHPSVCLLQTPAGRHGTPCRKCGTSPVAQGESVYVTQTHTHTPGLIRPVLAPDPSIKCQLAADVNNLHLNNYIRHFGLDFKK